ncbi:MAG: AarF/ABC1/UbiB kinase family protein [Myxococcota bacterium]|nr:AarF/ABC1/UbiB kinase family protein [Myxococcota bacterium]
MDDNKTKLPLGRFSRITKLASASLKTGADLLSKGQSENRVMDTVKLLGQLRGVAAKMGQMMSYVDGIVPEGKHELYEKTMETLQTQAPKSNGGEIRALVESEFGQTITEAFATWEDDPIASASIGQVHRATLHDGRQVAVKVHHPGIEAAMEADLRNAAMVEMPMRAFGMGKFDSKRLTEEVKQRFREELDYHREAESQMRFREIHRESRNVHIPKVIASHSTARVLTTEFVEGIPFKQACQAPENERRAWAETLWRFVYKASLVEGLFNADPHPGNYIFRPNGEVGFIDFGCIQPFQEKHRAEAVKLHIAANQRDWDNFYAAAHVILETHGGAYERMVDNYIRSIFRPITAPPFRITRNYAAGVVKEFGLMCKELMTQNNDHFVPLPPGILFINRLQFGFFSVLARLNVEVDYAAVEREYLETAKKPKPEHPEMVGHS